MRFVYLRNTVICMLVLFSVVYSPLTEERSYGRLSDDITENEQALYDSLITEGFNNLTFNNPTMAIKFFKKAHKISKTGTVYAGLGLSYLKKVEQGSKKIGTRNRNEFQGIRVLQNARIAIKFCIKFLNFK